MAAMAGAAQLGAVPSLAGSEASRAGPDPDPPTGDSRGEADVVAAADADAEAGERSKRLRRLRRLRRHPRHHQTDISDADADPFFPLAGVFFHGSCRYLDCVFPSCLRLNIFYFLV